MLMMLNVSSMRSGRGSAGGTPFSMKAKIQSDAQSTGTQTSTRTDINSTLRIGAATSRPSGVTPVKRFEDRGEIARGGMSTVRCVFDNLVLREVAMKVLEPTRDFDQLARFVEEAQITGQLDHPNIVPIHDIEMDEQGLPTRFTMKLVRGETLSDTVIAQNVRTLTGEGLEQLLQAFLRICDAVAFAHSRGVIHRDLKPSNIMIGSHGQVYVMDWGVALLRDMARTVDRTSHVRCATDTIPEALGSLTGTPAYMAPEQARGEISEIDERTDVYGLGGILYFLLTQRAPHEADNVEETLKLAKQGDVAPPGAVVAAADQNRLPPLLCRIAMRALSPARDDRYPNVSELKRDVEAFLRGGGWFAQQHFPAGTTIISEGDSADAAYIITDGQCELFKLSDTIDSADFAPRFVCQLGPGEVFGEAAIFTSTPRTGTIIAKTDVTALVVTRAALERELDRSQWLGAFVRAIAQRFVDVDRKLNRRK
jgi:eukaryotic-like serine/threonine-protein kinase